MPLLSVCYYNESEESLALTKKVSYKGNKPLVLFIHNDPAFLMHVKDELEKEEILVTALTDSNRAVSLLYELKPDCIIVGVSINSTSDLDVLHYLKDKMKQQFIPTIMISDNNQKEVRMKSYQMGADDFIEKPFDMDEFIVRVKRQLERKELIDHLVLVDELTLVYNRKYLGQVFELFQSEIVRNSENFSLAILDLDYFKHINDTYGHLVGDKILREFAGFLKQELSSIDILIRFGGEEFVVLMPRTNSINAEAKLKVILDRFAKKQFVENDQQFHITVSGGLVEVTSNAKRMEEWLELADSALYEAKNSGRNCIKVVTSNEGTAPKKIVKVGVVDDDPIIRTMIIEMIENMKKEESIQIDAQAFRDGAKFFESDWYKSEDPYILLLDGMMPRMDGLEVLQRIRAERDINQYNIVMLTSRKSEQDISRGLQLGADDYITKPFNLSELEARLKRLIQRMK
nr:diguanylate cyclase [Bacillus mesophilus]